MRGKVAALRASVPDCMDGAVGARGIARCGAGSGVCDGLCDARFGRAPLRGADAAGVVADAGGATRDGVRENIGCTAANESNAGPAEPDRGTA